MPSDNNLPEHTISKNTPANPKSIKSKSSLIKPPTKVEQHFIEKSGWEFQYLPTEKIPVV